MEPQQKCHVIPLQFVVEYNLSFKAGYQKFIIWSWEVIKQSSIVISRSSESHQKVIRQSSDSLQTDFRQSSESHQTAIRQPSDSHQAAIRQPSESHQAAIRQPSDSHQTENFFILVFLFCFSWRGFYYSSVFLYGCSVLWNKPWLWDIKHCWYNYPLHRIDGDVWWYYMVSRFELRFKIWISFDLAQLSGD